MNFYPYKTKISNVFINTIAADDLVVYLALPGL